MKSRLRIKLERVVATLDDYLRLLPNGDRHLIGCLEDDLDYLLERMPCCLLYKKDASVYWDAEQARLHREHYAALLSSMDPFRVLHPEDATEADLQLLDECNKRGRLAHNYAEVRYYLLDGRIIPFDSRNRHVPALANPVSVGYREAVNRIYENGWLNQDAPCSASG